jgi:outer membrane protein TolC
MPKPKLLLRRLSIAVCCAISIAASMKVRAEEVAAERSPEWWKEGSQSPILVDVPWVSFDLNTVVLEAVAHNPRIAAVNHQASISLERILQEDAVFDPAVLLESKYGSTSDPVGNSLTTGGPPRLHEDSWNNKAGVIKNTRSGTSIDLSQQAGLLNSNSLFFAPNNQGNTRLNLSVTKPLRAGAGKVYNERLIIQARIDSRISLQQARQEIQQNLAQTMATYWKVYQTRCHVLQQRDLLERGIEIEKMVLARRAFDSGELEVVRVKNRIARRRDELMLLERDLLNLQTNLAALVSSDSLRPGQLLEMIPLGTPDCVPIDIDVRDAVITAVSLRPEVRSAAIDLESAALEVSVTRNELLPQLDAVVGGYLAGLNGENDVTRSFGDQFADSRPGINAGLQYEMPYAQRAAKSRQRAARKRVLELNERYRESVALTHAEVETAARNLHVAVSRLATKREIWTSAVRQEALVLCRWESLGPEGRHAALVLEDLLNQQESRTSAEKDLVAAEVEYMLSLIALQQSMGTLLTAEGGASLSTELLGEGAFLDAARPDSAQPEVLALPQPVPSLNALPLSDENAKPAPESIPLLPLTDAMIESEPVP